MGWKAACIFAGDCQDGYLGSLPEHLPGRADEIIAHLSSRQNSSSLWVSLSRVFAQKRERMSYRKREPITFESYPAPGRFIIGAYERACFIADQDTIFDCFENREHEFFQQALRLYPEGRLLMIVLHSVVDYFGYAYYEKGKLIRELSGSADGGLLSDSGALQKEEAELYETSLLKEGVRYFYPEIEGKVEEGSLNEMGEWLTFLMAGKFLGEPMDRHLPGHKDHFELGMELFVR